MTNKTVIRKNNEGGKFTTIHHSILLDTRLSATAFRLLTMILSDSDTEFNLSQTLYCNRLGITKPTFFSAIDNLEDNGYLRKTELKTKSTKNTKTIKKLYSYTISEFGNLNSKDKKVEESVIEKKENFQETTPTQNEEKALNSVVIIEVTKESAQPQVEIKNDLSYYLESIDNLLNYPKPHELVIDMMVKELPVVHIKKEVDKFLKGVYNENLAYASNNENHSKAFVEFKSWLKNEIFKKHNLDLDAKSKWTTLRLIKHGKKFSTDLETMMGDYYESAKD
ncbi:MULTISPECIES: hypothetical protein [unclassified Flavobacterium]|uniref:hypothetical protein n=1 Tax=unclassified Flavobacterium TaxID=196869 RepID=UPI00131C5C0F|nr:MULTISPECIES: hypothetical protein [unclassified Flavobacterium]